MTDDQEDSRPDEAKRLMQARRARGFERAKDAATYFGWSYPTYHQHETGERGISRAAPKYATAFRVNLGWLLTGEGQGPDGQIIAPEKPKSKAVPGGQLVSAETMPVFAAAMGGEGHIIVTFDEIDRVKKPAELENVKGGYGLLVKGTSMVPALNEGDTALVNPHLPPARDQNIILYHTPPNGGEVEAIVKTLVNWTDREWTLKQWNPAETFKEYRQEWPVCHRVVGVYYRR